MPSIVDRHQQAQTRRVLSAFGSAWPGLDGSVDQSEKLIASALVVAPRDEALLHLRAWHLSWGPVVGNPALQQHHLQRWSELAGQAAGRWALERLITDEPESHESPLLLWALPAVPAPAVQGMLSHLERASAQDPTWLPLQTLLLKTPVKDQVPVRNAWHGIGRHWSMTGPPDLPGQVWLGADGTPDPMQPCRSAWWQALAGLDGPTLAHLMGPLREAWGTVSVAPARPVPSVAGGDGEARCDQALREGLVMLHAHDDHLLPGRVEVWGREAKAWIQAGARLPHRRRFDLPRRSALPWEGNGFPDGGTYGDAVTTMGGCTHRHTVDRALWYAAWSVLRAHEQRAIERQALHATAQAVLDEQGATAGHLKTRPRL